ncbi:unnamed protein product [Rotaria sp. Silwood2]|nr:unnamed protein product [Rotaria sp. Silwood2]CAF4401635.1 unnamed protein product [Rotaria sp. Silwood2]CAF4486039.1 unnamed protein product [Rotaria sp. Silwood2]
METNDATDALFEHIDTNQDGNIDKSELRNWYSNTDGLNHSSYESTTSGLYRNDNRTSRFDRYNYNASSYDVSEPTTDKYVSYGTTVAAREWANDAAINTSSVEETNKYLRKSTTDLFLDPNPQIIRRATIEGPITLEQRIAVRYLQPPPLPEPGPLIIKEVRPRQPSPLPPLVIREHAPRPPSPPPLILRERPPTPPAYVPSETITRSLSPIPVPPRSVVIERFPPPPEKPRDIIIERWVPYGPQPERRTIVEHAPPAIDYPRPYHKVILYETAQTRIIRRFEKLGVTQENPDTYVARYGSSLLDPTMLTQESRHAGVIEDISPPVQSSSIYRSIHGNTVDYNQSEGIIKKTFTSSGAITDIKRDGSAYRTGFRRYT